MLKSKPCAFFHNTSKTHFLFSWKLFAFRRPLFYNSSRLLKNNQSKAETYTGSGKGMGANPVVLEVAIEDGAITAITVVSHEETPGLSDPAFENVPAAIIEKQSLAVDTVSGATLTSNAILAAVEEAAAQAGLDVEALKAPAAAAQDALAK